MNKPILGALYELQLPVLKTIHPLEAYLIQIGPTFYFIAESLNIKNILPVESARTQCIDKTLFETYYKFKAMPIYKMIRALEIPNSEHVLMKCHCNDFLERVAPV